jgi:hypothetical protein
MVAAADDLQHPVPDAADGARCFLPL